jgi:(1->4)-alpha-D-glucan 1-alpha-D-glucosylmutase
VPRWNLKLGGNWSGTSIHLPSGRWKNLLTHDQLNGGPVPMQTVLQKFPVALLQLEEA